MRSFPRLRNRIRSHKNQEQPGQQDDQKDDQKEGQDLSGWEIFIKKTTWKRVWSCPDVKTPKETDLEEGLELSGREIPKKTGLEGDLELSGRT